MRERAERGAGGSVGCPPCLLRSSVEWPSARSSSKSQRTFEKARRSGFTPEEEKPRKRRQRRRSASAQRRQIAGALGCLQDDLPFTERMRFFREMRFDRSAPHCVVWAFKDVCSVEFIFVHQN